MIVSRLYFKVHTNGFGFDVTFSGFMTVLETFPSPNVFVKNHRLGNPILRYTLALLLQSD